MLKGLPPLQDLGLHFDLSFLSFSSRAEHPFADILIIEQHIHLETGEFLRDDSIRDGEYGTHELVQRHLSEVHDEGGLRA